MYVWGYYNWTDSARTFLSLIILSHNMKTNCLQILYAPNHTCTTASNQILYCLTTYDLFFFLWGGDVLKAHLKAWFIKNGSCSCNFTSTPKFLYSDIWQFGSPDNMALETSSPKTRKKFYQWHRQISGIDSKRPPHVSLHQSLWYLLTPFVLLQQLLHLRRLQKTGEYPHEPKPADEGEIHMEYSSDKLYSPVQEQ